MQMSSRQKQQRAPGSQSALNLHTRSQTTHEFRQTGALQQAGHSQATSQLHLAGLPDKQASLAQQTMAEQLEQIQQQSQYRGVTPPPPPPATYDISHPHQQQSQQSTVMPFSQPQPHTFFKPTHQIRKADQNGNAQQPFSAQKGISEGNAVMHASLGHTKTLFTGSNQHHIVPNITQSGFHHQMSLSHGGHSISVEEMARFHAASNEVRQSLLNPLANSQLSLQQLQLLEQLQPHLHHQSQQQIKAAANAQRYATSERNEYWSANSQQYAQDQQRARNQPQRYSFKEEAQQARQQHEDEAKQFYRTVSMAKHEMKARKMQNLCWPGRNPLHAKTIDKINQGILRINEQASKLNSNDNFVFSASVTASGGATATHNKDKDKDSNNNVNNGDGGNSRSTNFSHMTTAQNFNQLAKKAAAGDHTPHQSSSSSQQAVAALAGWPLNINLDELLERANSFIKSNAQRLDTEQEQRLELQQYMSEFYSNSTNTLAPTGNRIPQKHLQLLQKYYDKQRLREHQITYEKQQFHMQQSSVYNNLSSSGKSNLPNAQNSGNSNHNNHVKTAESGQQNLLESSPDKSLSTVRMIRAHRTNTVANGEASGEISQRSPQKKRQTADSQQQQGNGEAAQSATSDTSRLSLMDRSQLVARQKLGEVSQTFASRQRSQTTHAGQSKSPTKNGHNASSTIHDLQTAEYSTNQSNQQLSSIAERNRSRIQRPQANTSYLRERVATDNSEGADMPVQYAYRQSVGFSVNNGSSHQQLQKQDQAIFFSASNQMYDTDASRNYSSSNAPGSKRNIIYSKLAKDQNPSGEEDDLVPPTTGGGGGLSNKNAQHNLNNTSYHQSQNNQQSGNHPHSSHHFSNSQRMNGTMMQILHSAQQLREWEMPKNPPKIENRRDHLERIFNKEFTPIVCYELPSTLRRQLNAGKLRPVERSVHRHRPEEGMQIDPQYKKQKK